MGTPPRGSVRSLAAGSNILESWGTDVNRRPGDATRPENVLVLGLFKELRGGRAKRGRASEGGD